MKKVLYPILSLFLLHPVFAQINKSLQPSSLSLSENFLPQPAVKTLPAFDLARALSLDKEDAINNKTPAFSRSVYTSITLDNSGNWSDLPNGDRIWRTQVTSTGAKALLPYFNQFYLPQGATLHLYTPDKKEIIGAFTSANNPDNGYYSTGLIHGESFIIEYYEPKEVKGQGIISLNEIGYAYNPVSSYFPQKSLPTDSDLSFLQSGDCEVNVNCSEGDNWQNQKRSVACIVVQGIDAQYICSGSVVNNVNQDCTPYFLSAQHCTEGATAKQFSQWVFYFNYEAAGCANPTSLGSSVYDFVIGCTKVADSNDNGGDFGSDFLLLKLNVHQMPSSYNVYYAGWTNDANAVPQSGVSIHHPKGDIKKISTFKSPTSSASYSGNVLNTHWSLQWASTTNGYGVTEPGSSGSPLFNEDGLIVGHLTSGYSDCTNLLGTDYYGKVSYDWLSDGSPDSVQLKQWLDPNNTGATSLTGMSGSGCLTGIPVTSIENPFRINPNPSNGLVNLYFDGYGERNIQVFDALGRLISTEKIFVTYSTLDLRHLSKGVYILTAETENGRASQKLIIE